MRLRLILFPFSFFLFPLTMSLITTLLQSLPDPTAVTVATDMEGTLSDGVTWKGLRNYLIANGREADFKRFIRQRYHLIAM